MELGEEPFEEIIPDLPVNDPFGDDGITRAESAFLGTFPDRTALDNDRHLMMRLSSTSARPTSRKSNAAGSGSSSWKVIGRSPPRPSSGHGQRCTAAAR